MMAVCRLWKAAVNFMKMRLQHLQRPLLLTSQISPIDRLLLKQHKAFIVTNPLLLSRYYQSGFKQALHLPQIRIHSKTNDNSNMIHSILNKQFDFESIQGVCLVLLHVHETSIYFTNACKCIHSFDIVIVKHMIPFFMWIALRKPSILKYIPDEVSTTAYWYCNLHKALHIIRDKFRTPLVNSTERFVYALIRFLSASHESTDAENEYLKRMVQDEKPLLPFEMKSGYRCIDIFCETKRELKSASKPVIVNIKVEYLDTDTDTDTKANVATKTCTCIKTLMYKQEDLLHDMIVQSTILLLCTQYNLSTKSYYVGPLTIKQPLKLTVKEGSGIVLFEEGATLSEIRTSYNNSICEYITSRPENKNKSVQELKVIFYKSVALQSLVSLLYQIGDRHNGNLLVLKNGQLMHIDTNFLWSSPLLSTKQALQQHQDIKITSSMLSMIGHHYNDFMQECKTINRYIRQFIIPLFCLNYQLTQQAVRIDVRTLQNNFEKYICSCSISKSTQDVYIENIINDNSKRNQSIFQAAYTNSIEPAILATSSVTNAVKPILQISGALKLTKNVSTVVEGAFALRSMFGLP